MPSSSASEEWKRSETAAARAMSAGLQRERARRRRPVGRSRRRVGGGVLGEAAAVATKVRGRGGVEVSVSF